MAAYGELCMATVTRSMRSPSHRVTLPRAIGVPGEVGHTQVQTSRLNLTPALGSSLTGSPALRGQGECPTRCVGIDPKGDRYAYDDEKQDRDGQ